MTAGEGSHVLEVDGVERMHMIWRDPAADAAGFIRATAAVGTILTAAVGILPVGEGQGGVKAWRWQAEWEGDVLCASASEELLLGGAPDGGEIISLPGGFGYQWIGPAYPDRDVSIALLRSVYARAHLQLIVDQAREAAKAAGGDVDAAAEQAIIEGLTDVGSPRGIGGYL